MTYEDLPPSARAYFDAVRDPEFQGWGQEDWPDKEKEMDAVESVDQAAIEELRLRQIHQSNAYRNFKLKHEASHRQLQEAIDVIVVPIGRFATAPRAQLVEVLRSAS